MLKEQDLKIITFIKCDMVDILKLMFGRCLKVETKIIIPQEEPIERYNAVSNTTVVSSTGNFITQDRPPYGYMSIDGK